MADCLKEGGRYLRAAFESWTLGLPTIDTTLKTIPDDPSVLWTGLAEKLSEARLQALGNSLDPRNKKNTQ
jgi:hypothetical protein